MGGASAGTPASHQTRRLGWQALAPGLGLGEQSASRERAERMRAKVSFLSGVFLEGRH